MGKETQFSRAEVAPIVAGDSGDWRCDLVQVRRNAVLVVDAVADRSDRHNRLKNPSPLDDPLTSDLNRAAKIISRRQDSHRV